MTPTEISERLQRIPMAPDAPTPDPNPGSDEARELGCRCPVLDNAHGRGAWGTSGDDAVFWTSETCPLHGWPDA